MCAWMTSDARCQLPVVKFVTQRGIKISGFMSASPTVVPHWAYAAFHIAFEDSSRPPLWTPRSPPPHSVQLPVRGAAGRQPQPLPERCKNVIDTRRSAKRRVAPFVSLHLFLAALFSSVFTRAALSITCFEFRCIQGNGHLAATPQWNEHLFNLSLLLPPCSGSSWIRRENVSAWI